MRALFLIIAKTLYPLDYILLQSRITKEYQRVNIENDLKVDLVKLLISGEDHRFRYHFGFDIIGILRAIKNRILYSKLEGASTIEQQLVRVLINNYEISLSRKVKEIVLATTLSHFVPRKDIPSIYINIAYYGTGMVGLEQALNSFKYGDSKSIASELVARLKYPQPRIASSSYHKLINRRKEHLLLLYKSIVHQRKYSEYMISIQDYINISDPASKIKCLYTNPDDFRIKYLSVEDNEKYAYLYHYIINNVPFAFKEMPILFEQLVTYLADKFHIAPSNIRLIGSAKTGFSISTDKYGDAYLDGLKDLDFTIIDERVFDKLKDEFESWVEDYKNNVVAPKNLREREFWNSNKNVVIPSNIERGFIDIHKVPSYKMYNTFYNLRNTMYLIHINLKNKHSIDTKYASARVYKDWNSFIAQLKINTDSVLIED